MQLIEQTMAELRGEEWHEEINPEINVDLSAYLPEGFISDIDVRLNLYRRLSSLREEAELEVMIDEMKDRFGSPPVEVSNLMAVMSVRLILKKSGVSKLDVSSESLIFTFSPESNVEPEKMVKLVERDPNSYQFLSERKLKVKIDEKPSFDALLEAERITRALDLSQNI